jgi:WD40 repeat protein
VANAKDEVAIINTETAQAVYTAEGASDGTFWLSAFSPDSSKAAFIRMKPRGRDEADTSLIEIVDIPNKRVIATFDAAPALGSGSVTFTPDGNDVFFPSKRPPNDPDYDKAVFVGMGLPQGELKHTIRFQKWDGLSAVSADAKKLLSWRGEIWDAATSSKTSQLEWPTNYSPASVRFLPGGNEVRALDKDFSVRTWDAKSGKLVSHTTPPKGFPQGFPAQFNAEADRFFVNNRQVNRHVRFSDSTPIAQWTPSVERGWRMTDFVAVPGAQLLQFQRTNSASNCLPQMAACREFRTVRSPPAQPKK